MEYRNVGIGMSKMVFRGYDQTVSRPYHLGDVRNGRDGKLWKRQGRSLCSDTTLFPFLNQSTGYLCGLTI